MNVVIWWKSIVSMTQSCCTIFKIFSPLCEVSSLRTYYYLKNSFFYVRSKAVILMRFTTCYVALSLHTSYYYSTAINLAKIETKEWNTRRKCMTSRLCRHDIIIYYLQVLILYFSNKLQKNIYLLHSNINVCL